MDRPTLSVVAATYFEEECIDEFIRQVLAVFDGIEGGTAEQPFCVRGCFLHLMNYFAPKLPVWHGVAGKAGARCAAKIRSDSSVERHGVPSTLMIVWIAMRRLRSAHCSLRV